MERRNAWKIYTADQLKELDQINTDIKYAWMKERRRENVSV